MPIRVTIKIALITLCCFLFCCTPKTEVKEVYKPGFTNFEISFAGYDQEGGMGQYSFALDSNKSFFVMSEWGKRVNYGILPDSVFKSIDSLIVKIISKKHQMIYDSTTIRCGLIRYYAAVVKYRNDSLKIRTWESCMDSMLFAIDRKIQKFARSLALQVGGGDANEWETFKMLSPYNISPIMKFMEKSKS